MNLILKFSDPDFMAMKHIYSSSLVFAAILCGSGPLVADDAFEQAVESDRPWLKPAFASEQGATSASHLISRTKTDLLLSFTGETLSWGNNRFTVPLQQELWSLDSRRSMVTNALAIEWQHSMNASNMLTLSARRGDSLYSDAVLPGPSPRSGPASSDTAATLSWSSLFGGESRVIGQFYAGDEDTRERGNGNTDRRYFGLLVEGRYGLWRDHAPFASFKWQRSQSEMLSDNGAVISPLRREDYSHFGAGWNWRVSPSWDIRAEAHYLLADDSAEAAELDRTQFYFSTRYGFR
jgi:hypothetical protein